MSAAVREAWEFYRDNCQGFKEPMRREFRKLDECVDSLESENAKLREENLRLRSCLSDDAENARMIMGENAKLRELVRDMWTWQDALPLVMRAEIRDRMRELGAVG